MSREPNRNVYVGHRYVPKIMGEWDNKIDYEGLSIVTHQGTSYTSKKRVPVGIDIFNTEFWVVTGNYNAQVEYYRQDVVKLDEKLDTNIIDINQSIQDVDSKVDTNVTNLNSKIDNSVSDLDTDINTLGNNINEKFENETLDYLTLPKTLTTKANIKSDLEQLVNKCINENKGLYIPNGEFNLTENYIIEGIRNIKIDGDILLPDDVTLSIFFDSQRTSSCHWEIGRVFGGKLRIAGLKNANVRIQYATHLEFWADGDIPKVSSMAYSQFHLGDTRKVTFDSKGYDIGWINENLFYGGRLKDFTMTGNYHHNNNKFYGPMIEGCKMLFEMGYSNSFYDIRLEGENDITFEDGTSDNVMYRTWQYRGVYLRSATDVVYPVTDNGVGNGVVNKLDENYDIKTLFELHSKSDNFSLNVFEKHENHLTSKIDYRVVYETGLIPVTTDIGLNGISNEAMFRAHITFYDENKNLITRDQSDYRDMTYRSMNFDTNDHTLKHYSNVRLIEFGIYKNSPIKYFKVKIMTGSTTVDRNMEYFRLNLKHMKGYQVFVPVMSRNKNYSYNQMPNTGYWRLGDRVINNTPDVTRYMGWLCIKDGVFGTVNEPEFVGYGLLTSEV